MNGHDFYEFHKSNEFQVAVPATLMKPYLILWTQGYSLSMIGEILSHISTYGTVEGCPDIRNERDRDMIESVIPDTPREQWDEHESWRYELA